MSNNASLAHQVIAACAGLVSLATVGMFLRIYARLGITRNFGLDDAMLVLAWMLQMVCAAFIFAQTAFGLGRHLDTVTEPDFVKFLKMVYGSLFAYNISLTFSKVSILLQYQRFLYTSFMKTLSRIILALIALYGCTTVATTLVLCLPVGSFWDTSGKAHFLNREILWLTHASLNITSDIVIILLPLPALMKLSLPRRQKYGLVGIFAVGIIVCIISILRLRSVIDAAKSQDLTWVNAHAAIWSQSEISVSIFCASLPGMKALIRAWTGHSGDTAVERNSTHSTAGTSATEDQIMREAGPLGSLTPDLSPPEQEDKDSGMTIYTRSSTGLIVAVHIPRTVC